MSASADEPSSSGPCEPFSCPGEALLSKLKHVADSETTINVIREYIVLASERSVPVESERDILAVFAKLVKKNLDEFAEDDMDFTRIFTMKYMYMLIKIIEIDGKVGNLKKIMNAVISTLDQLDDAPLIVFDVVSALFKLPLLMVSKWELLAAFFTANLIAIGDIPSYIFDEVRACSSDQDCAVRASSFVVALSSSSDEKVLEKAAHLVYSCLTSTNSATRSNVIRSWLARMIPVRKTRNCMEKIVKMARSDILEGDTKSVWPLTFRQLQGTTCVDLEWRASYEEEPYSTDHFAYIAYLNVFLVLSGTGAQFKIDISAKDQCLIRALDHYEVSVRVLALSICRKYRLYPDNLEQAVVWDLTRDVAEDVLEIVDDHMFGSFSEDGKEQIEEAREMIEDEKKSSSRFYPAQEDDEDKKLKVEDLETAIRTRDSLLSVQSTETYPSVANVMETLGRKGINERCFAKKMTKLIDAARDMAKGSSISDVESAQFIFGVIAKCPLRSVVDYGGEVIKAMCKNNEKFADAIFEMCKNLLSSDEETTRALTFEVCLVATVANDGSRSKVRQIWKICKGLNEKKQKKMLEMFAKVVSSSQTIVEWPEQHNILMCALGLRPQQLPFSCTQLVAAIVSKMFYTGQETHRVLLFVLAHKRPYIFSLIAELLDTAEKTETSSQTKHLLLFVLSRFLVVNPAFYTTAQITVTCQIAEYVHKVLYFHLNDDIMASAAVDAMCSGSGWESLRGHAYETEEDLMKKKNISDSEKAVRSVFRHHLRTYHYWKMLKGVIEKDQMVQSGHLIELNVFQMIGDVIGLFECDTDEYDEQVVQMFLDRSEMMSTFDERNSVALGLALVSERVVKMTDTEKRDEYLRVMRKRLWSLLEEVDEEEKMLIGWVSHAACRLGLTSFRTREELVLKSLLKHPK